MGGRGSLGGTRSTYRGNSTAEFNANNGSSGGGGGNKGTKTTKTGGKFGGSSGGSSGGSDGGLPPPPPSFPENIRKKPHNRRQTFEEIALDVETINPRWREAEKWNINCQRCTNAIEFRARGYDVTAQPKDVGDTRGKIQDIANQWVDADGNVGQWEKTYAHDSKEDSVQILENAIMEWPEGARGFVLVQWEKGGAHIFNVERRDGSFFYMDGQSNQPDAQDWKTRIDPALVHGVMRVDHLNPTEVAGTWVRERTTGEINAPTSYELNAEMKRRGYSLGDSRRTAFRDGWQAVRTGQDPDYEKYSWDEDSELAYEQAVEWARRPD